MWSVQETFVEKLTNVKPGVYLNVDQTLQSICKKFVLKTVVDKFLLSWKLDAPSESLRAYYEGKEWECLILEITSQDFQNVLGMKTPIDCSENDNSTKEANKRPVISKTVGKFPPDLSSGCNTIFCIAIWCKMIS